VYNASVGANFARDLSLNTTRMKHESSPLQEAGPNETIFPISHSDVFENVSWEIEELAQKEPVRVQDDGFEWIVPKGASLYEIEKERWEITRGRSLRARATPI